MLFIYIVRCPSGIWCGLSCGIVSVPFVHLYFYHTGSLYVHGSCFLLRPLSRCLAWYFCLALVIGASLRSLALPSIKISSPWLPLKLSVGEHSVFYTLSLISSFCVCPIASFLNFNSFFKFTIPSNGIKTLSALYFHTVRTMSAILLAGHIYEVSR